jgi:site-specific DNA-cytosine methylase
MKILLACEESQALTKRFREQGHDAYSCDIQPCSGGHPEWHMEEDVIPVLKQVWDMVIAFPPCTDLAVSGAAWFKQKQADGRQEASINFFMEFTKLDHIPKVVIENPVGIMSRLWRKPDQIIQPYQFGEDASKKTCLWIKGLPLLKPTKFIQGKTHINKHGKEVTRWANQCINYGQEKSPPSATRGKFRSKTYDGIAEAIVKQYGIL